MPGEIPICSSGFCRRTMRKRLRAEGRKRDSNRVDYSVKHCGAVIWVRKIGQKAALTSLSSPDRPCLLAATGDPHMRYQLALDIHERLEAVLRLIQTGEYSTPALAEQIGVSIPTISRIVATLREMGHDIVAVRHDGGWRFKTTSKITPRNTRQLATGDQQPAGSMPARTAS